MEVVRQQDESDQKSYSGYDADELGQYRSVCSSAVVAFLLGLISPVALISPLLLVIPLLAVAAAWLALSKIEASAGGLTGVRLAKWGLALAIFFFVLSLVRTQVISHFHRQQADRVARQWLSYTTSSSWENALAMLTPDAQRGLIPSSPDARRPPAFDPNVAIDSLANDQKLRDIGDRLSGQSGPAKFTLEDVVLQVLPRKTLALCHYDTSATGGESAGLPRLDIVLQLISLGGEAPRWLVHSWNLENGSAD